MRVRLGQGVRHRKEDSFGGICYVPFRDDFFAADHQVYRVIEVLTQDFQVVPRQLESSYTRLAKLGICDTEPPTKEEPYSLPSFLGEFAEIPTVKDPLVVNCFSTAHCPLRCIYCYADDLMQQYCDTEGSPGEEKWETDTRNVLSTAKSVPAMVAVISGGEPLVSPERTIRLIEGLTDRKALVLDTSGVGRLDLVLPCLVEHKVHVRVSLDSLSNQENAKSRPLNQSRPYHKVLSDTEFSLKDAKSTIEKCLDTGLGVTVQTVVHSNNEKYDNLVPLRDGLMALGVKNWVLHIAVGAGRARKDKRGHAKVLPREAVRNDV